jgi:hypothetical protein
MADPDYSVLTIEAVHGGGGGAAPLVPLAEGGEGHLVRLLAGTPSALHLLHNTALHCTAQCTLHCTLHCTAYSPSKSLLCGATRSPKLQP